MIEIQLEVILEDTRVIKQTIRIEKDVPKAQWPQIIANLGAQFSSAGITDFDEANSTGVHYGPKLINSILFKIEERLITPAGTARVIEGTGKLVGV